MITLLNDSEIVYESFLSEKEMVSRILFFIKEGKHDRIIFKGDPKNIDGKQKRKCIIKDFRGDLENLEKVKKYFDFKTKYKTHDWCVLYKNK